MTMLSMIPDQRSTIGPGNRADHSRMISYSFDSRPAKVSSTENRSIRLSNAFRCWVCFVVAALLKMVDITAALISPTIGQPQSRYDGFLIPSQVVGVKHGKKSNPPKRTADRKPRMGGQFEYVSSSKNAWKSPSTTTSLAAGFFSVSAETTMASSIHNTSSETDGNTKRNAKGKRQRRKRKITTIRAASGLKRTKIQTLDLEICQILNGKLKLCYYCVVLSYDTPWSLQNLVWCCLE